MPPQLDELLARVDQCSSQAHELSAHFEELREQIRQAICIAQLDPEMSLARSRKVLEYIIRDIYDDALKPKRAGTQPLEGLVQTLVKEGQFPVRLAAYADMVRGLGNVGVHAFDKGVNSQDVLNSLSNLMPIVEWFFEHRKMPGAEVSPLASAFSNGPAAASPSGQRIASPTDLEPRPRARAETGSSAVRPAAEPTPAASKTSPPSGTRWPRLKPWAIGPVLVILAACGIWYVTHRHVAPEVSSETTTGQPVTPIAPNQISARLPGAVTTPSDARVKLPTISNSLGMELVLIPAGDFLMGSPENEPGATADEHPQHRVRITKPFYLATYSVTRGQFAKFVAATNYKTDAESYGEGGLGYTGDAKTPFAQRPDFNWRNVGFPQTDEHPVVNVSWNDAVAFCKWLSEQEGKTYRLPTEAEWEYACRAGSTTTFFFGDDPSELGKYAWFGMNSKQTTHEVGGKLPNPFGLYDMLGNVYQWCSDRYGEDYYNNSPVTDPQGPATGIFRVRSGGSFRTGPVHTRCAYRPGDAVPASRSESMGFRVVREPDSPAASIPPEKTRAPSDVSARLPTVTNSIGMQLTQVPAGDFLMGSPDNEPGAKAEEHPQHHVRITKSFYIGTYSVTRGQFAKFVAATNYKTDAETDGKGGRGYAGDAKNSREQKPEFNWRNTGFEQTDEHPVVNVSWNDAAAFCKWLGAQEGKTYRLPTEAEWEYACRAAATTAYFYGDNLENLANYANVADPEFKKQFPDLSFQMSQSSDGYVFTAPVGSFRPNRWGLCDMAGNVWQWCSDWYGRDYYKDSPAADPQGPAAGSSRVRRGGGFDNPPATCRCSYRGYSILADRLDTIGFRVVREP